LTEKFNKPSCLISILKGRPPVLREAIAVCEKLRDYVSQQL